MGFRDWAKNRSTHRLPSLSDEVSNHSTALENLLCQSPSMDCIQEKCSQCGIDRLDKYSLAVEKGGEEVDLRYTWDVYGKNDAGYSAVVSKTGSPNEFFEYLKNELRGFPYHRFVVEHQRDEIENLRLNLPKDAVLIQRDYAEKLTLRPKEETQRYDSLFHKAVVRVSF